MSKFNEKTDPKTVPNENFTFALKGQATFSDTEKKKVSLRLYDGGVTKHLYWGNLAFDLKSMKLSKSKVPILFEHETEKRLGFGDDATFDGAFDLSGELFDHSELAQDIKRDAAAGFEFESSLRFNPRDVKLKFVKDGESTQVNGNTLNGPGTVIYNAEVIEGSICVFGALKNTRTTIFNMQDIPAGVDAFKESHSDLFAKIVAVGAKSERDLFANTLELCEGDNDLAVKCYLEGMTDIETLKAKNAKLQTALTKSKTNRVDPAELEFSDTQDEESEMEETCDGDKEAAARAEQSMKAAESEGRIKIVGNQNKNTGRFSKNSV